MTITRQTQGYLGQLLASGLYGDSPDAVMERLISERIRDLLKDGIVVRLQIEDHGPHCPQCGSPKVSDISGMGDAEFQCQDCSATFKP